VCASLTSTPPLVVAAAAGADAGVEYLILRADIDRADAWGMVAVLAAAWNRRVDVVRRLQAAGATMHVECSGGGIVSVLSVACEAGCEPLVDAMFTAGHAVDAPMHASVRCVQPPPPSPPAAPSPCMPLAGMTLLCLAAASGSASLLRSLVTTRGASVDARCSDGTTAVMAAAAAGHVTAVRVLVHELAADVQCVRARDGATPLLLAACSGVVGAVRYLVDVCGCSESQRNRCGMTPLHLAAAHNRAALVRTYASRRGAGPALSDTCVLEVHPGARAPHVAAACGAVDAL
jgi:ankyrin repeat protein